ncbi:MAG: hypothetical protein RQ750_02855 [Roseovarius sp.]|nr:hypothetical protein [Roseovarius sp.]
MTPASVFTGLSAFPLTPATASGEIETGALRAPVARGGAAGVDSWVQRRCGSFAGPGHDPRRASP